MPRRVRTAADRVSTWPDKPLTGRDKTSTSMGGRRINTLVVDGIEVRTTLTEQDLLDPVLWSLRTPAAWARWLKLNYGGKHAHEAKQEQAVREDRRDGAGAGDQRDGVERRPGTGVPGSDG